MIRIYRHFFSSSTLLFVVMEVALLFTLTDMVVRVTLRDVGFSPPFGTAALSFLLVLTTVLSGLAIGLYRKNAGADFGWGLSALTATGLSLAFGGIVLIGFGALSFSHPVSATEWEVSLALICPLSFAITRWAAALAARHGLFTRQVLLVGDGEKANEVEMVAKNSGNTVQIVKRLGADDAGLGNGGSEPAVAASGLQALRIREVVVATEDPRAVPMDILLHWKLSGIAVTDFATFCEREAGHISLAAFDPVWFVYGEGCRRGRTGRAAKRGLDIVISVALLVLAAPVLCLFAALARIETPGPILYRQTRTGQYGKPFTLLKFRSMRVDAEVVTPQWATQNDPRITRTGRFMRSTRIDEFPQLINVIRGHMSLIGPRPERPYFVERLSADIPYYADRHYVRPGLTGWAQINYPYGASIADARRKLEYDLYYLKNQSIMLDFYIMLSTVRVILFREGSR